MQNWKKRKSVLHAAGLDIFKLSLLSLLLLTFLLTACRHEVEETPAEKEEIEFTVAPQQQSDLNLKYSFSRKGEPVVLKCSVTPEEENHFVSYQWYTSIDGTLENGKLIDGANGTELITDSFTEKGIYYYCCAVNEYIFDNGDGGEKSASRVIPFSVIYTALPVVQIDTVDGEEPVTDYVSPPAGCYGAGLKNATKVPARMKIFKYGKEEAIYDSGEYIKKESGLTIKLRGNTSAYSDKKPYKIKLQKKADLLSGICNSSKDLREGKYKDKEWILLKDGTSLNTFVGMCVADIMGTPWTPEFAYVNVVINGDYRGVYMLIEAISQSEKRVNVADSGYIIERDAYWWNEDVKFITKKYNQKYTFKYPDSDDITQNQVDYIEDYMNELEEHLADGDYKDYLDTESFARWLLIHDILGTWDSAGSNIYMSKYDSVNSKIFMSTTWDYDSNYRMKDTWANVHYGTRIYARPLLTSENTAFKDSYVSQWEGVSDSLWNQLNVKLSELSTEFGEDINLSRKCDAIRWGWTYDDSKNSVDANIETARTWFLSRKPWLDTEIGKIK